MAKKLPHLFGIRASTANLVALLLAVAPCAVRAQAVFAPYKGPDVVFEQPRRPPDADPSTFPRGADGHPDFTGIWFAGIKDFALVDDSQATVPLTAHYANLRKRWERAARDGKPFSDSVTRCEAFGMPRVMSFNILEFIATTKQLTVITEDLHEVRRIYLDNRVQPVDAGLTYDGHSVGHWEGDTLVVETAAIQSNAVSRDGIWFSNRLHVVERIRMANRDGIINEMTMTDPVALEKAWTVTQYYTRQPPGTEIAEYVCTNNRNRPDAAGRTTAK